MPPGSKRMHSLLDGRPGLAAGDFYIESRLAASLVGAAADRQHCVQKVDTGLLCDAAQYLGLDFLAVDMGSSNGWTGPKGLVDARSLKRRGFLVFCLVSGGFTRMCSEWGLGETLSLCAMRPAEAAMVVRGITLDCFGCVREALDAGCDAVILAEDFAYERGLFLHRLLAREVLWPEFECVLATFPRVVLHCDGDISEMLEDLSKAGFSGIHSMEPVGRMSLEHAASVTSGRVALLGGLSHQQLRGDAQAARDAAQSLLRAARGVPFALGSSSGILDDSLSAGAVAAAYHTIGLLA